MVLYSNRRHTSDLYDCSLIFELLTLTFLRKSQGRVCFRGNVVNVFVPLKVMGYEDTEMLHPDIFPFFELVGIFLKGNIVQVVLIIVKYRSCTLSLGSVVN